MVQSKKQGKYMSVFNAVYYVSSASACADPGIFTKWGGGGGVEDPGPPDSKKLGQHCFVIFAVF